MSRKVVSQAVNRAVAICGSQAELARRTGVKQGHVWAWLFRCGPPAERCIDIEAATDGAVTRYALRPDVFGTGPHDQAAA